MFAYICLLDRKIKSQNDARALQDDIYSHQDLGEGRADSMLLNVKSSG